MVQRVLRTLVENRPAKIDHNDGDNDNDNDNDGDGDGDGEERRRTELLLDEFDEICDQTASRFLSSLPAEAILADHR